MSTMSARSRRDTSISGLTVGGATHDLDARAEWEQGHEAFSNEGLVVRDDPERPVAHPGIHNRIRKPPSVGPAVGN